MNRIDPQPAIVPPQADRPAASPEASVPAGAIAAPPDITIPDASSPDPSPPGQAAPDLAAAVRLLSHASVLVIGDVMLDRYVYGQVTRISPLEAPVPILSVEREIAYPGGAGNVRAQPDLRWVRRWRWSRWWATTWRAPT